MTRDQGNDAAPTALDAALHRASDEQAALNAAAGRRTVALAEVLATAVATPEAMLDVEVARVASSGAERRGHVAHRALVAEVACALGISEHAAQGLLADADVLATKATATLESLCAGRISYQHAAKLVDAVADLPATAVGQVEEAVLDRAPSLTPARFGALARAARDRLHPIPAEVRREAAAQRAGVWVDDGKDGMSWLTAHVPTPVAHAVHDRLTRAATKAKASGDPRGTGQLRAAGFSALLLDVDLDVDRPNPDAGPPDPPDLPDPLASLARSVRPVVHVTVPVSTLAGAGEATAVLDGTVPLDAETARHLAACAPTLRRVLTDPVSGAMLTVDRRSYVVPADLRSFLTQRDVTCRFPGCRVPAARCDVDHTRDWADGGPTDAGNLAHLCRAHHTLKHESRWAVEQLGDGVLAWTSPRGRTYLTAPGSADRALAQLDDWAAEAQYLVREAAPAEPIGPPAERVLDPAPTSAAPVDDGDVSFGDPPF